MENARSIVLPDPAERPTLTVDEVAEILGLDRKTVYAAVNSGELPSLRVGRRILVPTSWLAARITPDSEDDLLTDSRSPRSQQAEQDQLPLR
jgi:excisionase family DNA binding protein